MSGTGQTRPEGDVNAETIASTLSLNALLAMPPEAYMDRAQIDYFRDRLLEVRSELFRRAEETREHLASNEPLADPVDRATVEEENMLEQRIRDRERKHLAKVEAALARIEAGSYGYCIETGEPIGLPRLIARPTAELCLDAQAAHERREQVGAA